MPTNYFDILGPMSDLNTNTRGYFNLAGKPLTSVTMKQLIEWGEIHYGDPPNVHCCSAGYTMGSIGLRVLDLWQRDIRPASGGRGADPTSLDHVRDAAWEIEIARDRPFSGTG